MGGNRVKTLYWLRNIAVVWFLTGFWHGADWTFIIWGLFFAVFLVLEKFWYNRVFIHLPKVFAHIYVTLVILISFVIFSGNGVEGMLRDLGNMFFVNGLPLWSAETGYYLRSYAIPLLVGILGATPLVKIALERIRESRGGWLADALEPVFLVAVLLAVTAYFVDGSFSPFLYFRF